MENYGSRGAKKYIFLSPITRLLLVVTRNGFERFTLLLIDGRSETSRAPYYGGKISGSQQWAVFATGKKQQV